MASNLTTIQEELRTLVAAHPYFNGISVISDDNGADRSMEEALETKGLCVVISEVLTAEFKAQSKSRIAFYARCSVKIRFNRKVNAVQGAPKRPAEAIQSVIEAIISNQTSKGEEQFNFIPEGEFVYPAADDEGLNSWVVSVQKQISCSAPSL